MSPYVYTLTSIQLTSAATNQPVSTTWDQRTRLFNNYTHRPVEIFNLVSDKLHTLAT